MNTMIDMTTVESAARRYADARAELGDRLSRLKSEQETVKRRLLQGIKNSLGRFTEAHVELKTTLLESRPLFERPKTRVFNNIRVGFVKERGKIEFVDAARTIALIEKLLPDQSEVLINVKKSPIKPALATLPASDLKRLGVTIGDDIDQPFIKATDGEIDKLIDALIGDDKISNELP